MPDFIINFIARLLVFQTFPKIYEVDKTHFLLTTQKKIDDKSIHFMKSLLNFSSAITYKIVESNMNAIQNSAPKPACGAIQCL